MIDVHDLQLILKLLIATLFSAAIGWDRERDKKPAGLRTHMLVGLGAALFVILGEVAIEYFVNEEYSSLRYDPIRILEAVVGGVAFLGAGTIFVSQGEHMVKGLTTAASLWATAGVGMAVGLEEYVLAAGATLIIVLILQLSHFLDRN